MKRATNRVYIAYGSNMNLEQMAYRCPGAKVIGQSTLKGWKLAFQGYPENAHANIIEEEGGEVPVLVWRISAEHEASLDRYEGVAGGYYSKHYLTIKVGRKTYKDALVYLMRPNPYNVPASDYLLGIVDGYMDAGISYAPVIDALKFARDNQGRKGI